MTWEEYYKILKMKHAETNWNNLQSVREYNEFARELRKMVNRENSENENAGKTIADRRL